MKSIIVDHIVIGVANIKETEKFYSSFLGEPASKEVDMVVYDVGSTKFFFILPEKKFNKKDRDTGGLNHIAFQASNLEELKEFESKLNNTGIQNSGIQIDKYGGKEFVWFDDPNGHRLEFYLRHA